MDAVTLLLVGVLAFQIIQSLIGHRHMAKIDQLTAAVTALQASQQALTDAVTNSTNGSDQAAIDNATSAIQGVQSALDSATTSLGGTPPVQTPPADGSQAS